MTKVIRVDSLTRFCIAALRGTGMREADAHATANVLVTTDTWGTFSHGTHHLPNYIKKIKAGGIDPLATPEVVLDTPVVAVIDGRNAIGMVASCNAMQLAITKARTAGMAYVSVKRGNHFGAAGYYASMAAEVGMIGLAMSNADPNMAPPGGRSSVIGNNPFAYAAPAGDEPPIVLDMALSTTAATKILAAKRTGTAIPDNWIIDKEGRRTTEVGDWPASGSLLPMAGHKGYGLALMVEVLAAVLSGSAVALEVNNWLGNLAAPPGLGHAFVAIDIERIMPIGQFKDRIDKMIRDIKSSPTAAECDRIYLPGEIEWERRQLALREGISMPDSILVALSQLSLSMDLPFQSFFD
jgi:ureidoglycolate dehydrogenase (NAD+)